VVVRGIPGFERQTRGDRMGRRRRPRAHSQRERIDKNPFA
jgi:hypothetical protein